MSRASIGFVASDNARTAWRRSGGSSRRSSATGSTRSCQFEALDERTIQRVVDKLIVEVEAQLENKGVRCTSRTTRGAGSRSAATTRRWAPGRWLA